MKKAELSDRRRRLWQRWRAAERLVRRMQRARAALVKTMHELLRQLDALAEERLQPWPTSHAGPPAAEQETTDGPSRH